MQRKISLYFFAVIWVGERRKGDGYSRFCIISDIFLSWKDPLWFLPAYWLIWGRFMFYLYKAITRTSRHICYLCTYKCKHLPVCVPADINPCTWTCRIYPCKSLSHLLWPLWQNAIGDLQLQVVPEDLYLHTCRCLPVYLYTCVLDTHLSLDPSGRMPFGTSTYRLRFLRMVSQLTLCWPDRCTVKLRWAATATSSNECLLLSTC